MSIATSKDVWPPKSFLQAWVIQARKSRFKEKGTQATKALIDKVNDKVRTIAVAAETSEKEEVLQLASA